ncbi:hypothetical protein MLD38_028385 [Melastoma candidum]|uniref:Uncharacterized protein n=1 Tax=Melastoma candidum TaxID=119954 RepID=A0ACB9N2N1_9MYRT|nr:hypothetical protein MLD38_028385 [Melastoma candidum]
MSEPSLLRQNELRLLRCTLPPPFSSVTGLPSHPILPHIESGDYHLALSSAPPSLFPSDLDRLSDSADSADVFYAEFLDRVEDFLVCGSDDGGYGGSGSKLFLVVSLGVAALFGFTQANIIGPLKELPNCPLPSEFRAKVEGYKEWDMWAQNQLMSTGSELHGKFTHLQYIVLAKILLMRAKDLVLQKRIHSEDAMRTLSWWLLRVHFVHQRLLDERSSSLLDQLQLVMQEILNQFGSIAGVSSYWGNEVSNDEKAAIVAMVHLESGIVEHSYGRIDSCRLHFDLAEKLVGLHLSVTGILGYRTAHQVEAKAQMVLLSSSVSSDNGDVKSWPLINHKGQDTDTKPSTNNLDTQPIATPDAPDILRTPQLLKNDDNLENNAPHLNTIQQAVILAKCLLLEKSSRQDEMQRWDMAPYIEAIDSQQSLHFVIRFLCDVLRVRWESTRSRTKERALLMMDNLVASIFGPSPGVAERIMCSYGVCIPSISALRKEYGELLIRCGLLGEAVKIFEELELWDNLIYCYRLLEKKSAAVELIKARLLVTPGDPRLWCSLGDVTNDETCYEKALDVSHNRSARAKRSLARNAYSRGEYEKSMELWEAAMALNSLYPDGWFALGAAALKARNVDKALDGFTRAVQLDPENGEAWNNIACLHMIKKRSKESFIAFKEALKFKRNSWQLWENFAQVAVDVDNLSQALEAIQKVLEITDCKRVDVNLVERIIRHIEDTDREFSSQRVDYSAEFTGNERPPDLGVKRSRETEVLVEFLGKILQQIVRSGCGTDIWGLYARWHKLKGDLVMCAEALLKQVRSYQGVDLWKDRDRFRKFAGTSLELCKVYMKISVSTGSRRELFAAEMHLKSTLRQAVNFTDMDEFKELQSCLEEVRKALSDSEA